MANSKRKGTVAERELANIFTAAGVPSRRSVQYCGRAGDADIVCDHLDLHIEVKRTERFSLTDAIAQASTDSASLNMTMAGLCLNFREKDRRSGERVD